MKIDLLMLGIIFISTFLSVVMIVFIVLMIKQNRQYPQSMGKTMQYCCGMDYNMTNPDGTVEKVRLASFTWSKKDNDFMCRVVRHHYKETWNKQAYIGSESLSEYVPYEREYVREYGSDSVDI